MAAADRLGVCSWSLGPAGPQDLVRDLQATGISAVQLALDPLRRGEWSVEETVSLLRDANVRIASGMMAMRGEDYSTLDSIRETGGVRLDAHWEENLAAARENARLARELSVDLVTFHAGFLPHEPGDPLRDLLLTRLAQVADAFAEEDVRVGFETGQETAETLLGVLADLDRSSVGVNFDPANMILYGMGNPVEALRVLAPHVVQVHLKDAVPTEQPGTWGTEVPLGAGAVPWSRFFSGMREAGLDVDAIIEREAGATRIADVRKARELHEREVGA